MQSLQISEEHSDKFYLQQISSQLDKPDGVDVEE